MKKIKRIADEEYKKELHKLHPNIGRMTDEEYYNLWDGFPPKDDTAGSDKKNE